MAIMDLSKAFDTVLYNKHVYKLKHYGISSDTVKWIRKFLKQRSGIEPTTFNM